MIAASCNNLLRPFERTRIFYVREGKMRKLCVLLTFVLASGLTVTCLAADVPESADAIVWRNVRTGRPVEPYELVSHCFESPSTCSPCATGCQQPASRPVEVAYFNSSCRGSYKFPVPPQYTYHWPGMYSQRCMTGYVSPYRFPPLKPCPGR